jgi:hypothetical protein
LSEKDETLTGVAFVAVEFGQFELIRRDEFVVEDHDDGVVMFQRTLGPVV